jgi:hypothetical protein
MFMKTLAVAIGLSFLTFAASSSLSAEEANPTAAPAKYLLQYKFAVGDVLRYTVEHATNVRTTIDGTTQQAETQSDSVKAWKVTDVLPNGEMEFIHLVEWVRMTNLAPERPTRTYDSRTDGKPPRGFEQAAGAVGVPLSLLRIARDGEVKFREEKHPQPRPTEDMPITLRLPKEPIADGEKWGHPYDVQVQRKGGVKAQVQTRRVCKLREVQTGVAVIDVEYQILTPVDQFVRSQLIERLTEGTVRFDLERGRVIEQEHNVDKRVLGFAGQTSSMHYVARLHEQLLKEGDQAGKIQQFSANLTP